jgi:methyl-accepting chemotaxis protein
MNNWNISFKLLVLVVIAIAMFVGMGLYGISNTGSTFEWVREINSTAHEFQRSAKEISDPLHRARELALVIVLAPDRATREKLNAEQERLTTALDATLDAWPVDRMPAAERAAFDELRTAWRQYRDLKAYTIDRALKGYREEAFINAIDSAARQFDVATGRLDAWQAAKIGGAEAVYRAAEAQFARVVRTSILVTVLTALLLGGAATFIVRRITGPLRLLTNTASRIADKIDDPGAEEVLAPVLSSGDEVGQLARDFWRMVGTLRSTIKTEVQSRARVDEIIQSTRAAVAHLSGTSSQLLAQTKEQTFGAENQAAAVAQIVTTLDEVTQTARLAADRAAGVGTTVQRTLKIGTSGRKAVDESVAALNDVRRQVEHTVQDMTALVEQTKAVSEIISTVDGIAQQSHLLAVNASIEAAKAGDHGKGFTVVATEVKNLADQSKEATAQVRTILADIQRATKAAVSSMEGVTQMVSGAIEVQDQSSRAINELADALSEVAKTSEQTVASAKQEALGMVQIHESMKNIDQVARQTLISIQGTTEAARQLNDLGGQLTRLSTG